MVILTMSSCPGKMRCSVRFRLGSYKRLLAYERIPLTVFKAGTFLQMALNELEGLVEKYICISISDGTITGEVDS